MIDRQENRRHGRDSLFLVAELRLERWLGMSPGRRVIAAVSLSMKRFDPLSSSFRSRTSIFPKIARKKVSFQTARITTTAPNGFCFSE